MVPTWFELMGIHGTFLMYSSIIFGVGLVSFFFMPETSGMTLEEIETLYRPRPKITPSIRKRRISTTY